jgi:hypothetical protein
MEDFLAGFEGDTSYSFEDKGQEKRICSAALN